jgi:hypothetical protein
MTCGFWLSVALQFICFTLGYRYRHHRSPGTSYSRSFGLRQGAKRTILLLAEPAESHKVKSGEKEAFGSWLESTFPASTFPVSKLHLELGKHNV